MPQCYKVKLGFVTQLMTVFCSLLYSMKIMKVCRRMDIEGTTIPLLLKEMLFPYIL